MTKYQYDGVVYNDSSLLITKKEYEKFKVEQGGAKVAKAYGKIRLYKERMLKSLGYYDYKYYVLWCVYKNDLRLGVATMLESDWRY